MKRDTPVGAGSGRCEMFDVTVSASGPIFDGRADAAVKASLPAMERAVAERGVTLIRTMFASTFKYLSSAPTGYASSNVEMHAAGFSHVITDGGIIYGPWLEGLGSRNSPVTRFPGYHTFRKATPILNAMAKDIANDVMAREFIGRMQ